MDHFPDLKKGDSIQAKHMNALNRVARDYRIGVPDRGYPGVPQRVMCITAVLVEPGDDDEDTDSESSFSSSSSHSHSSESDSSWSSASESSSSGVRNDRRVRKWYEALPMYWDHDSVSWLMDLEQEPYDLDAGAFDGEFEIGDTCIAYWDAQRGSYVAQPAEAPSAGSGGTGGCTPQNAIIQVTVLGKPTAGTFTLTLLVDGSSEILTITYNSTAAAAKTALALHTKLVEADLAVTGNLPNSTLEIEFQGNQANTNIRLPVADWTGLTGGTGMGVICAMAQLGHE